MKSASLVTKVILQLLVWGPLLATVYAIFSLWGRMISGLDLALLLVGYVLCALGITVGYHRMLTHKGFEAPDWIRAIFLILGSMAVAWWYAPDLNVLCQGDETARQLGIDPERTKRILFLAASMLVAASVAISGMIGFLGLIVPHCVRLLTGPDHRRLFPAAALAGALMLVVLDALARTVAAPREIPVGVLAALCGTPFFIYLLRRKKGEMF